MTFATDELISSTKLVRNFWTVLWKMKDHSISKVWILRNNDLEAVMMSKEEYERMLEIIEDLEDIALVEERMRNDDGTRYTMEEMAKKFNINLNSL